MRTTVRFSSGVAGASWWQLGLNTSIGSLWAGKAVEWSPSIATARAPGYLWPDFGERQFVGRVPTFTNPHRDVQHPSRGGRVLELSLRKLMTKVFKRRVSDLAINDMVDLTSCPYLRNQTMAGMVYGAVAHKEIEDDKTVVIGYEGIDHIGYPMGTVLCVKPAPIYVFPHELVECELGEDELGIRFYDKEAGVVIGDPLMDATGRIEVDPAVAYLLSEEDVKALNDLNAAVDAAVEDAINAMAKSIQDHLLNTTGDFASLHFSRGQGHRKFKKVAIRYALAEIAVTKAELVTIEEPAK